MWTAGDKISLFFNSGTNGGNQFTTSTSGEIATFTGTISAISGDLSGIGGSAYFWGVYPYNQNTSCNGTKITTTLPASQSAYAGNVENNLLVTVGRSQNLSIHFKNTCAVIEFTLSQENITKIVFKGKNNESVAGEFEVSFDDSGNVVDTPTANAEKSITITPAESSTFATGTTYYFAMLPGSFDAGYSLTFTKSDGSSATYERNTSFSFNASTFYTMTNKDYGLSFESALSNHYIGYAMDFASVVGNPNCAVNSIVGTWNSSNSFQVHEPEYYLWVVTTDIIDTWVESGAFSYDVPGENLEYFVINYEGKLYNVYRFHGDGIYGLPDTLFRTTMVTITVKAINANHYIGYSMEYYPILGNSNCAVSSIVGTWDESNTYQVHLPQFYLWAITTDTIKSWVESGIFSYEVPGENLELIQVPAGNKVFNVYRFHGDGLFGDPDTLHMTTIVTIGI